MNDVSSSLERIRTLTRESFSRLALESNGPVAVEFMSYACAHCGALETVLQQAAQALGSRVQVFRVNIGMQPELAEYYAIEGTPTLVMFLSGNEVGRVEGPGPVLSSLIADILRPFGQ